MNERKFDKKGSVYAKARPSYPNDLLDYLQSKDIIKPSYTVADIGSGTGIFTVQMSPCVEKVFAVEPNGDMRKSAEAAFEAYSNILSVNGTAENTTLDNSSIDVVSVAQAFHWFDRAEFKKECRRILKPNGKVVLVWNDRDGKSDVIIDNFEVNRKYCPNFKGASNGIDFSKQGFADFFEGEYDLIEFDNCIVYARAAFVARNLSSSYSPKKGDEYYDEYTNAINEVFDRHNINETVRYPYITRLYIGKV